MKIIYSSWSVFQGLRGVLALSIFVSLAQTAAFLPIAFLINDIFNRHLPQNDLPGLFRSSALILTLYLAQAGLALWNRRVSLSTSKKIIARMRVSLVDRLFGLSRTSFTQLDHASIHHGIVQDTERLDIMVNALITSFLPSGMVVLGLVAVLFYLDWALSLTIIPLVLVLLLMARYAGNHARGLVGQFRADFETFSGRVLRVLQSMDLIVSSATEKMEKKACIDRIESLCASSGWMAWFLTAYTKAQESVILAFGVLVLTLGGWWVIYGRMTLGELMSFYVVLVFLKSHFSILIPAYAQVLEGYESFHVLQGFLPEQSSPNPTTASIKIEHLIGPIRLENVSFGYGDSEILRGVDLDLPPGTISLVMGPSGSGKSTLCRILLGLHPIKNGAVRVQGFPLNQLDLCQYRHHVGTVMQDPVFFPGTLAENISYGFQSATMNDIEAAAQVAGLHETIRRMPEGYQSKIGERGVFLSGGQRQRLALARAFIRKPSLFIFDEPTNHLDVTVVDQFIGHLHRIRAEAMVLIVSHDPRLADLADTTYDIVDGRLLPRSPQAMLAKNRPTLPGVFP